MQSSTIARRVECEGVGLHSGESVRLALEPDDEGRGIVFVRPGRGEIPATIDSVCSDARATVLARGGDAASATSVATVEHLLASFYALGIAHVRIVVEGPELPALDGSAAPFLAMIQEAGLVPSLPGPRAIELDAPVEVREGDRFVRAEPASEFGLEYAIDFEHVAVGRQKVAFDRIDGAVFSRELAPARTFGFLEEFDELRAAGLAGGAQLGNTVVVDGSGVMNPEGLRFPDEFVRHKVVDLLGDLALLGAPLRAFVRVGMGGHRLHQRLVRAILDRPPQTSKAPRVQAATL